MSTGLELRGIRKFVGRERYLEDVDLHCAPGSFTVLLGHVRSGKTTLLRSMAGLERPDGGQVLWNGRDVTHQSVRTRDVAMVYQQFVNYPSLRVYDNIASPLRIQKRHTRAEIDRRVRDTAARLRIEDLLDRLPAELSGGQQQRCAIARALAKSAKLMLLDEPLANLDYKLREELRGELRGLFADGDTSVVYATSEPNEALWLGGTTAVLHEGKLLQVGPAREVYAAPQTELVAQVYSDPELNVFELELAGARAHAPRHPELQFEPRGPLSRLAPGPHRVGVRAHDVRVAQRSEHDIRVSAVVTLEEIHGSETLLRAKSGELQWTCQLHGVQRHALGAAVELFISPERLLIFDSASHHGPD
ncbi:MAG TPA: ABC transporter ATP-binding protein [Polyangiales bacterium]|nr:ABC transporter ATP-binding protein [Polyangiales bacterium]